MPMRLLIIDSIPTPYNVSFFAAVARHPGVVTRTILLAPSDSNRLWRVDPQHHLFDYRILRGLHAYVDSIELPVYLHWGLWRELRRFQPDVITIGGYHYFATLEVLAFARIYHCRTVLWSGSHLLSGLLKRAWLEAYKRWVISQFDAYLSYGTAAREQLVHYNAPRDNIIVGCNTVDVHWYKRRADELRRADLPTSPLRLLFVGRLVPIKNVDAITGAIGHLQRRGLDVTLTIVGDGPLRKTLKQQADRAGVRDVIFAGFKSGDDLVAAYINAHALVLPSLSEPWGLVVNEAAACGIPSVVSIRAGAAQDLIRDGESGCTFDPTVPGALEQILERLARDPELCRRMGRVAQQFILTRDQSYYAERLVEAAEIALASRAEGKMRIGPTKRDWHPEHPPEGT